MPNHVHLHVHSDASPKDGLGTVTRLIAGASSIQAPALALTDHGTLANAISFVIACKEAHIKPILGVEGYIAYDGEIGHITLLAHGELGWHNLVALNNLGHESAYQRPAFTVDQLTNHADGIVCLTGCISSPFNQLSLDDAVSLGIRLKKVFGNRLYAEVMTVADMDTWTRPLQLAERLKLKPVLTNDAHFPFRNDAPLHPILTQIKAGYQYHSEQLWLKSPTEMFERAIQFVPKDVVEDAMERSIKIANAIQTPELARPEQLPKIKDADEHLATFVLDGIKSYEGDKNVARKRAKYELDVISKMGFSAYFLILNDIVTNARKLGTRVGPGRGSGGGSFVLHMLGITKMDPIKYGLQFERFLNPERHGMPDVDTDFDSEHRQLVIEYAEKEWHATPVAIYTRYSHKTLLHDLCKFFKVPRELEAAAADDPTSDAFSEICGLYPQLGRAYKAFIGQIKNKGQHAGGVVITDGAIPIERTNKAGARVAAWTEGDNKELSYAGIVKFDLLGLTALSILNRLEQKFHETAPDLEDGSPVFKLFRTGNVSGIFQFAGSQGIVEFTKKVKPTCFNDLVLINALYRPGALDVGMTEKFPEYRLKPRKVHPAIDDILAPTSGIIVFQEQLMEVYSRIMKGTLAEADNARRVIVKSKAGDPEWERKILEMQEQFIEAAVRLHKFTNEAARSLWAELSAHARYSFNKSHAVAYAKIAADLAWWKFHHKEAFFAEMLNLDPVNAHSYLYDAVRLGVKIHPPHVNTSGLEYVAEGKAIFMPLSSIKFMGIAGAQEILRARVNGPFKDLIDFMGRCAKKAVRGNAREGLYALGGFEGLEGVSSHLKLKETAEIPTGREAERKYLGFTLPTPEFITKIQAAQAQGKVAGIITEVVKKKSRYGPYKVFHLSPIGACWSRTADNLQAGDFIVARVRKNSGRIERIEVHE